MATVEKPAGGGGSGAQPSVKVDVGAHGLKQHRLGVWTVVFMIYSLCAAPTASRR